MTTDELYSKYASYLDFLGLAEESKYRYLRIVDDYLYESSGVLTRDTVQRFMRKYESKSGTYRRWIMYVLKSLFENVEVKWPFVKRELPKLSRPNTPYLKVAEVERLLEIARPSSLDYALIRLDAATGARRKELSEVRVEDYSRPYIRIRTAKSGEERTRTLDPDTCNAIDKYIKQRRSKATYMFVSAQGIPLTPQTLSIRFKKLAVRAGFKSGTGWHSIRRGVVTWLFKGGMRERELQDALGWKSPTMPAKYIQLVAGEVEEKVKAAHPFFKQGERDGAKTVGRRRAT